MANDTGAAEETVPPEPGRTRPQRAWWHRHLEPEERRRVMNDLALVTLHGWTFRFVVMLTLAVLVAVMGLSANSAAVVIGAMLLAPLMTPVLGLAASMSMALLNKMTMSAIRVSLATIWCILIAYLVSLIIPNDALPSEVMSRTSPDLRDLVVALAAGIAGSYATVRKNASSALPGVAVAVALVPPLASVGITLEAGRTDLAKGAMLLYGTNLAAIIFAGVCVFVLTGFVPPRRLARTSPAIFAGAAIAAAVVIAVAVPLVRTSVGAAQTAQRQQQVNEAVGVWLAGYEIDVDRVDIDEEGQRVSVEVSGLNRPPTQEELERLLVPLLGDGTRASVQWTRAERATTTTAAQATTSIVTDEELRLIDINQLVDRWLLDNSSDDKVYELETLRLIGDRLRVDVVGIGTSPPVDDLNERLIEELGEDLSVTLTWLPRSIVSSPVDEVSPVDVQRDAMLGVVQDFALDNDLVVSRFEYDGQRVTIDLTGPVEPETTDLAQQLQSAAADERLPVDIYFTERRRLETTTTTE